jgi:hypothetical protein
VTDVQRRPLDGLFLFKPDAGYDHYPRNSGGIFGSLRRILKERRATLDGKIAQDQISIREVILQMEFQWPQSFTVFLPLEFKDAYRSQSTAKAGADFVNEVATDLMFIASQ